MAIISDKTYRITWGDYFSMDRNTYSLKEKIIALRDHGLEIKTDCLSSALDRLKDSISWLNICAKQNPTLSQDQATSNLLKVLYNKVDQYYRNAQHQEWLADEGKCSSCDGGNYDLSSYAASSSSGMVACSDSYVFDMHVHIPDISDCGPNGDLSPNPYDPCPEVSHH